MINYKMWINGKWVAASTGETIPVINPATEEVAATIAKGGKKEVDMAVAAAKGEKYVPLPPPPPVPWPRKRAAAARKSVKKAKSPRKPTRPARKSR